MLEILKDWSICIILFILVYLLIFVHRDETKIENKIFELVNQERDKVGIDQLEQDSGLNKLAKEHSIKMRKDFFFEHSNQNLGENIFDSPIWYWTSGCGITITNNQIADCMVDGWKKSPGHYSNIINIHYKKTGVGVSCGILECKGTQNFI